MLQYCGKKTRIPFLSSPETTVTTDNLSCNQLYRHSNRHRRRPPQPQQIPTLELAVAFMGPTIPFVRPWPSNCSDHEPHLHSWPQNVPPPYPPNKFGFSRNPFPRPRAPGNPFVGNQNPLGNTRVSFGDDLRRLGFRLMLEGI